LSPIAWAFLVAASLTAAADWWSVAVGRRQVEVVTKPLVIGLLIGLATTLSPESGAQWLLFTGALVVSLMGDVALLAASRGWFAVGLALFLAAHLCYVVGLLIEPGTPDTPLFGLLVVLPVALLYGSRIVRGVAARHERTLAIAVVAYLLVISGTVVAAGLSGDPLARMGALALFASDAILGWNRFVRPIPRGRLLTRIPYHLGQALMVVSLVA
jgi:uncharacterized membrane protein YhhN